MKLGSFAAHCI